MKLPVLCPVGFNEFRAAARSAHRCCCQVTQVHDAGRLHLPTGVIVVADGMNAMDTHLVGSVKPGSYPVLFAKGVCVHSQGRVTGALLDLSDEVPVEWEVVRPRRSEIVSFTSPEAYRFLDQSAENRARVNCNLSDSGCTNSRVGYDRNLNLISFGTGVGDGNWRLYWGLDVRGERVCLFADFGVLSQPEDSASPRTPRA